MSESQPIEATQTQGNGGKPHPSEDSTTDTIDHFIIREQHKSSDASNADVQSVPSKEISKLAVSQDQMLKRICDTESESHKTMKHKYIRSQSNSEQSSKSNLGMLEWKPDHRSWSSSSNGSSGTGTKEARFVTATTNSTAAGTSSDDRSSMGYAVEESNQTTRIQRGEGRFSDEEPFLRRHNVRRRPRDGPLRSKDKDLHREDQSSKTFGQSQMAYPINGNARNQEVDSSGHAIVAARLPPPSSAGTSFLQEGNELHRDQKSRSLSIINPSSIFHRKERRLSNDRLELKTPPLDNLSPYTSSSNIPITQSRVKSNQQPPLGSKLTSLTSNGMGHNTEKNSSENGSEGGYAGSASSNDVFGTGQSSCSSPSTSSDDAPKNNNTDNNTLGRSCNTEEYKKDSKRFASISSSSEIADFSSSVSRTGIQFPSAKHPFRSSSPRLSSYSSSYTYNGSSDSSEDSEYKTVGSKIAALNSAPSVVASKAALGEMFAAHSKGLESSNNPGSSSDGVAAISPAPRNKKRRLPQSSGNQGNKFLRSESSETTGSALKGTKTTGLGEDCKNSNNGSNGDHPTKPDPRESDVVGGSWSFPRRSFEAKAYDRLTRKRAQHRHELNKNFVKAKERCSLSPKTRYASESTMSSMSTSSRSKSERKTTTNTGKRKSALDSHQTPIYDVGMDIMSNIMLYLDPVEVHSLLSMPISKTWRSTFTIPQDLWKILCLSKPFNADLDEAKKDGSDDSISSYPVINNLEVRHVLGRYRLLYSSFVRCVRYLARIKEDAINGRTPTGIEVESKDMNQHPFNGNSSLQDFFAKAREIVGKERRQRTDSESVSSEHGSESSGGSESSRNSSISSTPDHEEVKQENYACVDDSSVASSMKKKKKKSKSKVKFGYSKLTQKLLGPTHAKGVAGHVDLPWSCAIYSVVNWMVAFTDVEGIQIMCLKVLPYLLEDENQRTTAQRAGLTDIVLRGMVLFPDSAELHTAAFHTLVLLARPLGGKEGMLFHSAMVNASGIFNVGSSTGKNGIAVMLDSMKRFAHNEVLQAMSCWSMVNIALIPSQKSVLVKLGGISVAANAMLQHPFNAEVQFRALFALINLVIPSQNLPENSAEAVAIREQLGGVNETSEKEMLDETVAQISNLVVVAMKNFCSSEAILNRACLVLHNLSLNEDYHNILLWTPNCYQMLEWCIGNYRNDNVLQQSAGGTLQRLQMTLANDNDLRVRFAESIRAQQQISLEHARREAMYLQEQEQEQDNQRQ